MTENEMNGPSYLPDDDNDDWMEDEGMRYIWVGDNGIQVPIDATPKQEDEAKARLFALMGSGLQEALDEIDNMTLANAQERDKG